LAATGQKQDAKIGFGNRAIIAGEAAISLLRSNDNGTEIAIPVVIPKPAITGGQCSALDPIQRVTRVRRVNLNQVILLGQPIQSSFNRLTQPGMGILLPFAVD